MIYLFTCGTCCAKIIYHNVDKSLWWFHSSETSLKELSKNTISFADPQLQLSLILGLHLKNSYDVVILWQQLYLQSYSVY